MHPCQDCDGQIGMSYRCNGTSGHGWRANKQDDSSVSTPRPWSRYLSVNITLPPTGPDPTLTWKLLRGWEKLANVFICAFKTRKQMQWLFYNERFL